MSMTVKELKSMISNMDDSATLTMQTPDGIQRDITNASQQGDRFTFWTDSTI